MGVIARVGLIAGVDAPPTQRVGDVLKVQHIVRKRVARVVELHKLDVAAVQVLERKVALLVPAVAKHACRDHDVPPPHPQVNTAGGAGRAELGLRDAVLMAMHEISATLMMTAKTMPAALTGCCVPCTPTPKLVRTHEAGRSEGGCAVLRTSTMGRAVPEHSPASHSAGNDGMMAASSSSANRPPRRARAPFPAPVSDACDPCNAGYGGPRRPTYGKRCIP